MHEYPGWDQAESNIVPAMCDQYSIPQIFDSGHMPVNQGWPLGGRILLRDIAVGCWIFVRWGGGGLRPRGVQQEEGDSQEGWGLLLWVCSALQKSTSLYRLTLHLGRGVDSSHATWTRHRLDLINF